MDQNQIQPPDMQGAGASPDPYQAQEAVGLLKSYGSMPAGMFPQMPQASQAAAAVSAGMPFIGKPDIVGHQMQQARIAQDQQFQQVAQIQRMKERQQERAYRQQQDFLKIGQEFLQSDSDVARAFGAKAVAGALKGMGVQVPGNLIEGLGTRRFDPKDANGAMKMLGMGVDDQTVLNMYRGLTTQDLQALKQTVQNPVALKGLGLKTPDELKSDALDLQLKSAKAVAANHPELAGDPKLTQATLMMHRKLNGGKDYNDGTSESQLAAYEAAKRQRDADEERQLRLKSELDTNRMMAGIDARLKSQQTDKPLSPAQQIQLQKQVEPVQKRVAILSSLNNIRELGKELDAGGMLPTSPSVASGLSAKLKRATTSRYDDALFRFKQLWGPVSIGQIDRGLFDEKGVRAIQAFSEQLNATGDMPTKKALDGYIDTIEREIKRSGTEYIKGSQKLGVRPEAIDVMKDAWAPYGDSGPGPSPLNPKLPPGTKLEGGKLISLDDKHEWDGANRKWIPRTQPR